MLTVWAMKGAGYADLFTDALNRLPEWNIG